MNDDAGGRDGRTAVQGPGPAKIVCEIDGTEMKPMEATFSYLGRAFRYTVLRCPVCGQVHIPGETAEGRMREVEKALEDK
jgi:hypothetical protein